MLHAANKEYVYLQEAAIQEHIQETKDLIKARCDRLAHDGEFNFTVMYVVSEKCPCV